MTIFTKLLFTVTLSFCLFSCARREQALYQKSLREQFTKANAPVTALSGISQSFVDSNQVAAASNVEASNLVASAHTDKDVIGSRVAPAWKSSSKAVQPVEKLTVDQTRTHQKKQLIRSSILKRVLADPPVQTSGLAIASLVCGIVSFLILGVVLGPLAIIFGGVALSKIKKNPEIKGRGLAVAGLVLGIVATIVIIVVLAAGSAK